MREVRPERRMSCDQTIYLVSCVGKKRATASQAKELYTSEWFLRARAHVERAGCPWFILSAKFGLMPPEQVIPPYELTLNGMPRADRQAWAQLVLDQMDQRDRMPAGAGRCVILAGRRYREFLVGKLAERYAIEVPMEGLGIGEQLRWLGKH